MQLRTSFKILFIAGSCYIASSALYPSSYNRGGLGGYPYMGYGFENRFGPEWSSTTSLRTNLINFVFFGVSIGIADKIRDVTVRGLDKDVTGVAQGVVRTVTGPFYLVARSLDNLIHGAKGYDYDYLVFMQNYIETILRTHIFDAEKGARAIRNNLLQEMQQAKSGEQQQAQDQLFGVALAVRTLQYFRFTLSKSLLYYNGPQRSVLAGVVDAIVSRDNDEIVLIAEQLIMNIDDLLANLNKIKNSSDLNRYKDEIERSGNSFQRVVAHLAYLVNKDAASDAQRTGIKLLHNPVSQRLGTRPGQSSMSGGLGSYYSPGYQP